MADNSAGGNSAGGNSAGGNSAGGNSAGTAARHGAATECLYWGCDGDTPTFVSTYSGPVAKERE